jgi:hypothetical protein
VQLSGDPGSLSESIFHSLLEAPPNLPDAQSQQDPNDGQDAPDTQSDEPSCLRERSRDDEDKRGA